MDVTAAEQSRDMAGFQECTPTIPQSLKAHCTKRYIRRNAPYIIMVTVLLSFAVYENVLRNDMYPGGSTDLKLLTLRQFLSQEVAKVNSMSTVDAETKPKVNVEVQQVPAKKKKITWKEQPILTMKFDGRLGNQMFEYAAIHAIARQKGMKVYLNSSHPLNKLFHIDEKYVVRKPCGGFTNVEVTCCDYNVTLLSDISNTTCQRIFGYFQSWRYFDPYLDSIRGQLEFQDVIKTKAQNKLRGLLRYHKKYLFSKESNLGKCVLSHGPTQVCTFIAMHVRRGDLMLPIRIRQGRLAAPKSYYIHAMEYYRRKYKNALFIVGSDSQDWAVENLAGPDVLIVRDMLPEIDLCLLSQCNHTIMSVGTFGWWVSFLSAGDVVYYDKAFTPNSSTAAAYKRYSTDFARPGWVGMS